MVLPGSTNLIFIVKTLCKTQIYHLNYLITILNSHYIGSYGLMHHIRNWQTKYMSIFFLLLLPLLRWPYFTARQIKNRKCILTNGQKINKNSFKKRTETDRNGQQTDRNGQRRRETDRNGQKRTQRNGRRPRIKKNKKNVRQGDRNTDTQTVTHTDITSYRLNRPRGQFSKNLNFVKKCKYFT